MNGVVKIGDLTAFNCDRNHALAPSGLSVFKKRTAQNCAVLKFVFFKKCRLNYS